MKFRMNRWSVGGRTRPKRAVAATLAVASVALPTMTGAFTSADRTPSTTESVAASADVTSAAASSRHSDAEWAPSATWDLANLDHERVDHWVDVFTTSRRDDFTRFLERMGRYGPMISRKLAERDMPQDLIYLAMIESGFDPTAYSHAGASGLWQFIEETGERYGLEVNQAVDERNDPERATDAALDYLQDLYDRFGSWYLAAAAYNTGENRVARLMLEETGSERGSDASYYEIWDRLPGETRDYVPLMIAAARIAKERAKYGFPNVEMEDPPAYEQVRVEPATPLTRIARSTGSTVDEIRELNPHLKLDRTRNDEPSVVRVPVEVDALGD